MLIKFINTAIEISLWLLLFGVTFSNSLVEVSVGIIIGLFILRRLITRQISIPRTPANIALYILCAVTFITFLRSSYFVESIRGFIRIIKYMLLYLALYDFFTAGKDRIKRTFWVLIFISTVTFINGIFQVITGFDMLRHREVNMLESYRRISASFVHPNDFGAYIIFILPMVFCFFCQNLKKNQRIFLVFNCLLGSYCLLKTSSRAAWLGFLASIILYFFIYKKKISVIVPLGVLLFILFSPYGYERLKSLFVLEENTVWERAQLWRGTWNMVKVHPFFGFGINTFSRYFLDYKPAIYPDIRYTHNSYLQMWSEIGILGLGSFIAVVFIIIKTTFNGIKNKIQKGFEGFILLGLITGYIGFLIQSGLDTNLHSLVLTTLFWTMSAYIMSLNKLLEKK